MRRPGAGGGDGGFEAVQLYRRHAQDISLVLLDVRMPGLDGPQTLALLRELNPHVCCCFMTGHSGVFTDRELLDRGAAAVLGKPFVLPTLSQTVRELLARPRSRPASAGAERL